MTSRSTFASRTGSALIVSLMASTALMILLTALITSRLVEQRNIAGTVRASQAQQLAEAGVDHMLGRIARDGGILPLTPPPCSLAFDAPLYYCTENHLYADGNFDVVADELPGTGQLRIRSTGTSTTGTTRTVEALIDIVSRNPITDQYAFLTCQDLTLDGSSEVHDGDVYSGGNLLIENGERITNGDVQAMGDIHFANNGYITGNVISEDGDITAASPPGRPRAGGYASNPLGNATLTAGTQVASVNHDAAIYDLPDYCLYPTASTPDGLLDTIEITAADFSDYETAALDPGSLSQSINSVNSSNTAGFDEDVHHVVPTGGELHITGSPDPFFYGTYYIDGDLRITGNYHGEATFVVTGNLWLVGVSLTSSSAESNHAFVVDGDVHISGNSTIDGAIYANGGVVATGSNVVNGSLVAMGTGSGTGSVEIHYRRPGDDADLPNKILAGFDIERWRLIASPF